MSYNETVAKVWEEIKRRITKRLYVNRHAFDKLGLDRFYIAGGALMPPEPNDYDLFPVEETDFDELFKWKKNPDIDVPFWETPNALTINKDRIKIQLCKFWSESLIKTVERFDFTHCKVGVEVKRLKNSKEPIFSVIDVYVSEDFIRYRLLGYSEYTGIHEKDYPLSSLLRVFKYIKKGYIRSSYDVIFKILEALLERGYKDEKDFEDQLKGIDVGREESEQLDSNSESLKHIYYLLTGNTYKSNRFLLTEELIGDKSK
jgi:hypothetical protein